MPIDQLLISEITTNLGQALAGRYLTSAAVNDLFEAYVLSLILSAAQNQEANVSYEFWTEPGYAPPCDSAPVQEVFTFRPGTHTR
jgi:hypothetical protein